MPEQEAPGKEKNWLTLKITHGGEEWTSEFQIRWKVRKVIEDALQHFNIVPAPDVTYYLCYGDLQLSDEEKSLQDYGIPSGATLILATRCKYG